MPMFEPNRVSRDNLSNYIGARVTDAEEEWLQSEMKRRKVKTMSDLIRLALGKLRVSRAAKKSTTSAPPAPEVQP